MKKQKPAFSIAHYLKKYKFPIAIVVISTMLITAISVLTPIYTADAIEILTMTDANYWEAIKLFIYVLACYIAIHLLNYINNFVYNVYSKRFVKDISVDLLKQSFNINSQTYANHNSGDFSQRIVSEPTFLINQFFSSIGNLSNMISTTAVIIYVFVLNYIVGLCLVAIIGVVAIIDIFRIKKTVPLRKNEKDSYSSLNAVVYETIKSEKDVKTSNLENSLQKTIDSKIAEYQKNSNKQVLTNQSWRLLLRIFRDLMVYSTLILGIVLLEKSIITISAFMLIYSYQGRFVSLASCISQVGDIVSNISLSKKRMNELFEDFEYEEEKFGDISLENVKGDIKFENVTFNYKDYEFVKDKKQTVVDKKLKYQTPVLQNMSFHIKPSTTVAFVGKSGSGKSTILSLISKMLEVDDGKVLIDDVDIKDLDKQTLRSSISLVNQFPYIFNMSIKDNLKMAKEDATDEEIDKAIENSFLKEFVDSLPNGLDTIVGESGIKLSGGQKQRLAIARALLRKTSIIIFDESTSSLDNLAQEHIKKCIDNLKGKSTIVIVAHRLSTIKNVDNIFFLENGKIVDEGTFDRLCKKNKEFERLFEIENLTNDLEEN